MDFFTGLQVSASALAAQRTRMNVLASNLANANSTRSADGSGPYQRKDPLFEEVKLSEFDKTLDRASKQLSGVKVSQITTDSRPGARVFDPGHPDADSEGYVQMPNVNVVTELTDIMATTRSYEANVRAMSAVKEMANKVLEIGRG